MLGELSMSGVDNSPRLVADHPAGCGVAGPRPPCAPATAAPACAAVQGEGSRRDEDPLALDAETMRAIGHQTVDMLCDPRTPALTRASTQEMVSGRIERARRERVGRSS